MCGFLQPMGKVCFFHVARRALRAGRAGQAAQFAAAHAILLRVARGERVAAIEQPVSGAKAERAIGFELLLATPLQLQIAGTACAALPLQSLQFPINRSMTPMPPCQKAGSRASRPKGASNSE